MSILELKLRNLEFTQTQSIHSPKASQVQDRDSLHIGFYMSEELVHSSSGTSLISLPPFSGKSGESATVTADRGWNGWSATCAR